MAVHDLQTRGLLSVPWVLRHTSSYNIRRRLSRSVSRYAEYVWSLSTDTQVSPSGSLSFFACGLRFETSRCGERDASLTGNYSTSEAAVT